MEKHDALEPSGQSRERWHSSAEEKMPMPGGLDEVLPQSKLQLPRITWDGGVQEGIGGAVTEWHTQRCMLGVFGTAPLPTDLGVRVGTLFSMFQGKNIHLLLNVFLLAAWGAVLLAGRLYWMGNKPPNFSNSDNPAADSPSLLARTLTFFYLPSVNVWLLLCPDMLSFDWSMDALPLVRSLADWRNLQTLAFYSGLLALAWFGLRTPQQKAKGKETNGKAHCTSNGRNGHGNSNGHSYPCSDPEPTDNHHHHHAHAEPPHASGAQNGTRKLHEMRTPLPATENVVVFSIGLMAIPFLPATNLFFTARVKVKTKPPPQTPPPPPPPAPPAPPPIPDQARPPPQPHVERHIVG
ncbi:hypothetical protein CRUP_018263 [Coryphaenoides rupestris]|nr:hypothetical protein CRUP_018263 [Coryphaenoides rupestris]